LNKVLVWKDASPFYPLRKNRSVRFGFCGGTVLLACRGLQVSFNTTVHGDVLLKDNFEEPNPSSSFLVGGTERTAF